MAYHANGNMGSDKNKGLDTVMYNYLNLPERIEKDGKQANYTYAADGRKLSHTDMGGKVTNYVGPYVYENGKLVYIITEKGRLVFGGDGSHSYEYNVKDHLGNTRLVYSDLNNDNFVTKAEILQAADYYPFGMRFAPVAGLSSDNKYLYNGKEEQEDTKWYDYGARMYDPAIGRFISMDPLAELTHDWTPYHYVYNNPLRLVDPTGMAPEDQEEKRKEEESLTLNDFLEKAYAAGARITVKTDLHTTVMQDPKEVEKTKQSLTNSLQSNFYDFLYNLDLSMIKNQYSETVEGDDGKTWVRGSFYLGEKVYSASNVITVFIKGKPIVLHISFSVSNKKGSEVEFTGITEKGLTINNSDTRNSMTQTFIITTSQDAVMYIYVDKDSRLLFNQLRMEIKRDAVLPYVKEHGTKTAYENWDNYINVLEENSKNSILNSK